MNRKKSLIILTMLFSAMVYAGTNEAVHAINQAIHYK